MESVAAKFQLYKDTKGEFRFKLIAASGETIAVSEGYKTRTGAQNGIDSVKKNAPKAKIEDKSGANFLSK